MNDDDLERILRKHKTVAVVGVSRNPSKDSYEVAGYLKKHGFKIVPVNPFAEEILGEKCYSSLLEMPVEVQKELEVVDIFRPSEDVLPIVNEAVELKRLHGSPYVVWMQLGIVNAQAANTAMRAGLIVVMDKCMMQEHQRLIATDQDRPCTV